MPLARWTGVVQDAFGNAVPDALVEVRSEDSGALVALFADRDGTIGLANPFTSASPTVWFHTAGGSYRIDAFKAGFQQTWRYVSIGTAGELDKEALQEDINAGLNSAVRTVEQDLNTDAQQQARANIGAASAAEVTAKPFHKEYVSAQQVITAAGLLTLTHGLGGLPKLVVLELVCIATGDGDYLIGDRVFINPSFNTIATASRGAAIIPSASNVAIRFGDNSQTFEVVRKGNGANLILNNIRWRLIVRAWA